MKLWCINVSHPKLNQRQRNDYMEQVVVIAESAGAAQARYQKHLDDLESDYGPKAKGRYKITQVFEYKGWFVSRGLWKA